MSEGLERLRTASLIALSVGAAGSVALTLYVGRSNSSRPLIGMFAVWVLSPFALLAIFARRSQSRLTKARTILYSLIIMIATGRRSQVLPCVNVYHVRREHG